MNYPAVHLYQIIEATLYLYCGYTALVSVAQVCQVVFRVYIFGIYVISGNNLLRLHILSQRVQTFLYIPTFCGHVEVLVSCGTWRITSIKKIWICNVIIQFVIMHVRVEKYPARDGKDGLYKVLSNDNIPTIYWVLNRPNYTLRYTNTIPDENR